MQSGITKKTAKKSTKKIAAIEALAVAYANCAAAGTAAAGIESCGCGMPSKPFEGIGALLDPGWEPVGDADSDAEDALHKALEASGIELVICGCGRFAPAAVFRPRAG